MHQGNGHGSTPATSNGQAEIIEDEFYKLDFQVKRSQRYLERRRWFFAILRYATVTITAFGGSAAVGAFVSKNPDLGVWLVLVTAAIGCLDYSIGFVDKTNEYKRLKDAFHGIEVKMWTNERTVENLRDWRAEKTFIEKDESTILRALDVVCHNQEAVARGLDDYIYKVDWYHCLLKDFLPFSAWQPELVNRKRSGK